MKKLLTLCVFGLCVINLSYAQTFEGTGIGDIPDEGQIGDCTDNDAGIPLNINFDVTGSPDVSDMSVNINFDHEWVGDLIATLIAPDGTEHILFGRTGATAKDDCGDEAVLNGLYRFTDTAAGAHWWTASANATLPTGEYRTSELGGAGQTSPAPLTSLSSAFNGVANSNGIWVLRIRDISFGDEGTVIAAQLVFGDSGNSDLIFKDNFEESL